MNCIRLRLSLWESEGKRDILMSNYKITYCFDCKAGDKCSKYCAVKFVRGLMTFLTKADFNKSCIGDIQDRRYGSGDGELVCSGLVMYSAENVGNIITPRDNTDMYDFQYDMLGEKSVYDVLKDYGEAFKDILKEGLIDEMIEKLSLISKRRLLCQPVKTNAKCNVTWDNEGKVRNFESSVSSIQWYFNRENKRFECKLLFPYRVNKLVESFATTLEDYGKTFYLLNMGMQYTNKKCMKDIVKMSDMSWVKPIFIKGDKSDIVIDNTSVYASKGDELEEIIRIGSDSKLLAKNIPSRLDGTREAKLLKDNWEYIMTHKRFIVPYGLSDSREV